MITEAHARHLRDALKVLLGRPTSGDIAFLRCLPAGMVDALADSGDFDIAGWGILAVIDKPGFRRITADQAVELREDKSDPHLLLIDPLRAGAGLDGIYSAAREIGEAALFEKAVKQALGSDHAGQIRDFIDATVKRASGVGHHRKIFSPFQKFDFVVAATEPEIGPGKALARLGLWPIDAQHASDGTWLDRSTTMAARLLHGREDALTPAAHVEALFLDDPDGEKGAALEKFLYETARSSPREVLAAVSERNDLWLGSLVPRLAGEELKEICWTSWWSTRKTKNKKDDAAKRTLTKWSGLVEIEGEDKPHFTIDRNASRKEAPKLEVRWTTDPDAKLLAKTGISYQVKVTSGDDDLAAVEVPHYQRSFQKAVFEVEHFEKLEEDARFDARIEISAMGAEEISAQSEEFILTFGEAQGKTESTSGKVVRTLVDGLIALADRETFEETVKTPSAIEDKKGFLSWRLPEGRSVRVFRPALIAQTEASWREQVGMIGRWVVNIRADGSQAGPIRFVPIPQAGCPQPIWEQLVRTAQKLCSELGSTGLLGRVLTASWAPAANYLNAWSNALENGDPELALHGTVEVRTMSERTIGTIVLPLHPVRFAWRMAYDLLAAHARYEQDLTPAGVEKVLKVLNSAQFPALLPGVNAGESFVFGDVLGFHAAAMTRDDDREPKAAVALMATCLGGDPRQSEPPSVGEESAEVLGREIRHYLDCHERQITSGMSLLNIHAWRPGDGMTVARALRAVNEGERRRAVDEEDEEEPTSPLCFGLELFPSEDQEAVAGRFLTDVARRRRSGGDVVDARDRWMTESVVHPGEILIPRLRWTRHDHLAGPLTPAHLSLAFDLFASRVEVRPEAELAGQKRPLHAFGLSAQLERQVSLDEDPTWLLYVPISTEGEKLPDNARTAAYLQRLQTATMRAVARNLGGDHSVWPVLVTRLPKDSRDSIDGLHAQSDWVVTIDRNACLEYFDSPEAIPSVYERYVIDAVPERADLGALQLVTSTSNLEEVRTLLDGTLTEMGVPASARNCRDLLGYVKALSGRLAIRLANSESGRAGEIAALALLYASSHKLDDPSVWQPLAEGFFIPLDEIADLGLFTNERNEIDQRTALVFVRAGPRRALEFRFIQVKFRRHLRMARQPELHAEMLAQASEARKTWTEHFFGARFRPVERAVRRSQLARLLGFYADKAARHHLSRDVHQRFRREIDKLLTNEQYQPASADTPDYAYIFCPDLGEAEPDVITAPDAAARICLFGPTLLLHDAPEPVPEPEPPPSDTLDEANDTPPPDSGHGTAETEVKLGTVIGGSDDAVWRVSIRSNPHLLMVGLPGMGKTTCLINLCRRLHAAGVAPIVFSYHEDIDAKLTESFPDIETIDCDRLGFNPLRIDPRQDGTIAAMAHVDVAGELRDIFGAIFTDLGDLQTEQIRMAVKRSYSDLGWGDGESGSRPAPSFRAFFDLLNRAERKDRSSATLLARLNELADYGFFDAGGERASLLLSSAPALVRVHSTSSELLQRAFASFVFYSLYKDMFRRGVQTRLTHAIVFDEAHRASRLKLIPTMAKECRKYGLSLILASQEARDFSDSLYSAVGNYLALRLTETDARALARKVISSHEERRMIDRLKGLEKYTALFFPAEARGTTSIRLDEA